MTASPEAPIAVDAMGGDHAPDEIVAGAVAATREHGLGITLVGHAGRLRSLLADHNAAKDIPVVPAEDELAMDEGALASLRRPRSSIAVACHLVRRGEAGAVVSAGSTGGVVATGRLRLRGQAGVLRPAIAVVLPTRPRPTVLVDAGANADVKPEMLVQFAQLGSAYAEVSLGIERPRVGLLNIGTEPAKGNKTVKRAFELLEAAPIDFTGNVEGDDVLTSAVDVIVTDGFSGNIVLKAVEGAVRYTFGELRSSIEGSRLARFGGLLQRSRLSELRSRLDSETHGGAVLLGLNATVVIAHGASRAPGITAACRLADALTKGQIVERIRERIAATPRSRRPHWP